MHGKAYIIWVVALIVMASVTVLSIRAFMPSSDPSWVLDSGSFLKQVGIAFDEYSDEHSGALPQSLSELYPQYCKDKRITQTVSKFAGKPMAIVYYNPNQLGNPKTALVGIRLVPGVETRYNSRGWVLWGNLQVATEK